MGDFWDITKFNLKGADEIEICPFIEIFLPLRLLSRAFMSCSKDVSGLVRPAERRSK